VLSERLWTEVTALEIAEIVYFVVSGTSSNFVLSKALTSESVMRLLELTPFTWVNSASI